MQFGLFCPALEGMARGVALMQDEPDCSALFKNAGRASPIRILQIKGRLSLNGSDRPALSPYSYLVSYLLNSFQKSIKNQSSLPPTLNALTHLQLS